jgi:surfactin synthase thioesterase subunit
MIHLPDFFFSAFLHFVRKSIEKRAHFNIKDLDILKFSGECKMPVYFICSKEDTYIKCQHTIKMFQQYKGTKKLKYVTGDHNEPREDEFY